MSQPTLHPWNSGACQNIDGQRNLWNYSFERRVLLWSEKMVWMGKSCTVHDDTKLEKLWSSVITWYGHSSGKMYFWKEKS